MAGIHEAIIAVMGDIGAIGKDQTNPIQKYKYRGIDDVMNALQPALIKHGVYITPTIIDHEREERSNSKGNLLIYSVVKVKYTFYAKDGTFIETTVMGEAMDSGDKATNKAMSAAFKYACFQTFCIPTEEMIDTEKDSPEPVPKGQQTISDKHAKDIKDLLEATGSDVGAFLKFYKVESVEDMTELQYENAKAKLEKKKGDA